MEKSKKMRIISCLAFSSFVYLGGTSALLV